MQQLLHRASVNRYTLPPIHSGVYGLGAASPAQIVGAAGGAATPVIAAVAAPAVAAALGVAASVAVPLVGLAFTAVLMGIEAIMNSGCGQTCIVTSQWANQAAAILDQNIHTYFSLPAPRTTTDKQSALNIFDAAWARLVQLCSQGGLGTAGQNCISDRQAGACKWKQTADKVPAWGTPAAGECWNWFNGYRDPIANDPVVPDTGSIVLTDANGTPVNAANGNSTAAGTGKGSSMLLLAAAALLAYGATQ